MCRSDCFDGRGVELFYGAGGDPSGQCAWLQVKGMFLHFLDDLSCKIALRRERSSQPTDEVRLARNVTQLTVGYSLSNSALLQSVKNRSVARTSRMWCNISTETCDTWYGRRLRRSTSCTAPTSGRGNYRRPTYPEENSERTPISPVKKGPPRWIRSSAWSESASRCSASASLHLPNEASCPRAALLIKSHGIKQVRPLRGGVDAWESMMRARRLRDRRSAQGSS